MSSPIERVDRPPDETPPIRRPADLRLVSVFLLVLTALLAGYMFLGRGFAHLGWPPVYVGEAALFIGLVATTVAVIRLRLRPSFSLVGWLLVGFMVLGFARTAPYLPIYGVDALRDAVLWGYALFALMIYVLADRAVVLGATRLYGWVVPVFALWLPISFNVFILLSANIQASELGSNVPIVFFKSGDMAVHIVGSLAFLVLVASRIANLRTIAWRSAIALALLWTAFVAGATNRGGLLAVAAGIAVMAVLAALLRRSRNWVPVLIAPAVLALVVGATGVVNLWAASAAMTSEPERAASGAAAAAPSEESPPVVAPPCEPPPRSLVGNPGFELGTLNDGTIEGWSTWAGLYDIVTDGAYRGANYASIQNTGEAWLATITSAEFPFEAGWDISVSLRAKAIEGNPVVATYVNWYDSSGSATSVHIDSFSTDGRSTWRETDGVLTAPEGTTHASVQLYEAAGNAVIGLDEIIVESATTTCEAAPASRSLVGNPGFELGTLNDGTIEGWSTWAGLYNIVTDGASRGANYASIQNTGEAWLATIASAEFPFVAGQDISISLWAKAIEGNPVVATYVSWYDSSGTETSVQIDSFSTDGRSTWQKTDGVLTAPEGTTHARVQLYETAGNAAIGVDEIIVESGDFDVSGPETDGRPATIEQIIENVTSIFGSSDDETLEGTRAFRLRWWNAIVQYTVFGEHFWSGKGFGINLADADGFQANEDGSLRAPHNSHLTALARMGVPGFVLWALLQVAFGIGLVRSILANRRWGDWTLAAVGAWILVYWVAMMVNTSFDPYLEGPQGGIWFWSLFGLGMVVMRLSHRQREA